MNKEIIYLELAFKIAELSKDESTQCGCVVIGKHGESLTWGYNGAVRGAQDAKIPKIRPEKYLHMEHAERNAIYNAARVGVSLLDSTFFITGPPCPDCFRGIIQVGAKHIVYGKRIPRMYTDDWANLYDYYGDLICVTQI